MEYTSNMKYTIEQIAESIRKNGLPQYFGDFYKKDNYTGSIIAACAIGQAAVNLHEAEFVLQDYLNTFISPDGDRFTKCPRVVVNECTNDLGLATMVEHLNDEHNWTFEQIADWLMEYKDWKYKAY